MAIVNISNLTAGQKVVGVISLLMNVLSALTWAATHFLVHPFSGFTLWSFSGRGQLGIDMLGLANDDQSDSALKYHVFQGSGTNGSFAIANDLLKSSV